MGRGTFATLMALLVGLIHVDIVAAQQAEQLKPGVVKITAKAQGVTKVGTGFIVRREKDAVYIVTAAHVVGGDSQPRVEFFTKRNVPVPAEVLPGAEGDDELRGLALLLVKGKEDLPSDLSALSLDTTRSVSEEEDIIVIGFPQSVGPWNVTKGSIGSRQGRDIFFSPAVGTGNSGGPIIRQGKVVGMVMAATSSGHGITARSVQDYIEGFGITAQESTASGTAEKAPESKPPTEAKVQPTPSIPAKPEKPEVVPDREITGKDGAPMVLIPAGEFWMGSPDGEGNKDEHPRHLVDLDAFYMDKFEVSVARYAEFLRSTNRSKPHNWDQVDITKHGNLPVIGVNWKDADAYCRWAGKRLPTEAEWEKSARGTDGRIYPWGNEQPSAALANFGERYTSEVYEDGLAPVESHESGKSPYGIYNMAGNVWEWVADWYDGTYYGQNASRNPRGPTNGEYRVLRGGSWGHLPVDVRSASRYGEPPTARYLPFGFRCARDAPR